MPATVWPWPMELTKPKSVANETTLSNEEDGIGHYLNELLNLKAI